MGRNSPEQGLETEVSGIGKANAPSKMLTRLLTPSLESPACEPVTSNDNWMRQTRHHHTANCGSVAASQMFYSLTSTRIESDSLICFILISKTGSGMKCPGMKGWITVTGGDAYCRRTQKLTTARRVMLELELR